MDNLQEANQDQVKPVPFEAIQHDLANIMPSASEIGHLWTSYLAESMAICFLKNFIIKSKDQDIHAVLQRALDVSSQRVKTMQDIFNSFHHPIPEAYGQRDVDVNSKQLFNEIFKIKYTRLMHKFVMINYSNSLSLSSRSDIRSYFTECLDTSKEIHQKATEVLIAKGLLIKSPSIVILDRVDFVHDKNYFGSILGLGNKRPLNALEISHIVSLMETKQLLRTLKLGYGQVVKSEQIKHYISRAKQIADKQLNKLGSFLDDEDLPQPISTANLVSDSTESPHSDKLFLCHVTVTIAFILAEYGLALTNTARKDLVATFSSFMLELLDIAKDGAELMMENGWLERVPETVDREKLYLH
ncbi:MAG: DUF3231 family protein [Desulfosporosinus sp.]|nr:DUF3231 family protein [Desulfosporosinus sp.]